MRLRGPRFHSHFYASQALGPALAYLFEAPNIINPSGDGDLAFQRISRVCTILGIIIISALVTTLALIIMVRKRQEAMSLSTTDDLEIAQSSFLQNVASFHSSWYEAGLAEFRSSIGENQRRHDVTTYDPEIARSLFLQNVASFHSSWYEVGQAEFRRSIEENQRRHNVTAAEVNLIKRGDLAP